MMTTTQEPTSHLVRAAEATSRPTLARVVDEDQTEAALRLTYRSIIPRLQRDLGSRRLGISRPSYVRACVRNHAFMVGIAEEMGEWYERVIRQAEKASRGTLDEWRRIERRHVDDAAMDLQTAVHSLLPPIRQVIIMRSCGTSWRGVWDASGKNRPFFSLKDDWRSGIRQLGLLAAEPIARLS